MTSSQKNRATVSPQQKKDRWGILALVLVVLFYGAVVSAADAKKKPKKRAPVTAIVATSEPAGN